MSEILISGFELTRNGRPQRILVQSLDRSFYVVKILFTVAITYLLFDDQIILRIL